MLLQQTIDGAFLIRESESTPGIVHCGFQYLLMVCLLILYQEGLSQGFQVGSFIICRAQKKCLDKDFPSGKVTCHSHLPNGQ